MQVFFKFFLSFFIFLSKPDVFTAQIIFYQDIFKGGVTGDGFNSWFSGNSGTFILNIPANTTIRKAFLFVNVLENPLPSTLIFNNVPIDLNSSLSLPYTKIVVADNFNTFHLKTLTIDITNLISPGQNNYTIQPPQDQLGVFLGGGFAEFYVCVFYENNNLPTTNSLIYIDTNDAQELTINSISGLNAINLNYPIGLSLHTNHFCDTITEGSYVKINGDTIGLIGGIEPKNNLGCAGVMGSFYYENNLLYGLDNDTPDNLMKGTDAIADISSYITNNTQFDITLIYQSGGGFGSKSNPLYQIYLAYTTTCEEFSIQVTPDTTICHNSPPLQLSASGGTQYLWQPATDLSCTTCPNPVFTGDSSRFYTVCIWNNDSCSVVRPVKVNVKPLPSFSSMQVSPSSCGGNTGYIVSNSTLLGESYSINGGALQQTGSFPSLSSGTYTVTLHELNGCTRDSVVTVGTDITVDALFTATPHSGGAPLTVYFNNQSTNATAYEWFLNNQTQGNSFSNFTFDTTGIYTVTLVAWQNDPSCADTFSIQIHVYDSLIVQVPNVFTPNNDGKNDIFGIQANIPVYIDYQILNRWGNVMISGKEVVSAPTTSGNQFTILWDGSGAIEGTYFYKIEVTALSNGKKEVLDGFMELIR